MRILLLGCKGQIGTELSLLLSALGELITPNREVCDLLKVETISQLMRSIKPDLIVNAAAYTAVDLAEKEKKLAKSINATAVDVLARETKRLGSLLVHYSTDYVFDGKNSLPYTEDDQTNPINFYGQTKLQGEEYIRESGCAHLIFRTSWVHSPYRSNFIKTMLRLANSQQPLRLIKNQRGAPTSAKFISEVTTKILSSINFCDVSEFEKTGVYNLTSSGETNWYDYAKLIFEVGSDESRPLCLYPYSIEPITANDFKTDARRPENSLLNTTKMSSLFGIEFQPWDVGVLSTLDRINQ